MIEIDDRALDTLLAEDPGGPVVMLNLLRFRPDGGRESYRALRRGARPGDQRSVRGAGGVPGRRRAGAGRRGRAGLGHGVAGPLPEPAGVRRHDP